MTPSLFLLSSELIAGRHSCAGVIGGSGLSRLQPFCHSHKIKGSGTAIDAESSTPTANKNCFCQMHRYFSPLTPMVLDFVTAPMSPTTLSRQLGPLFCSRRRSPRMAPTRRTCRQALQPVAPTPATQQEHGATPFTAFNAVPRALLL